MLSLNINTKKYRKTTFIENMNLEVAQGDFVIIKGRSGSGKSTLLNILNLLDNNYEGSYTINNQQLDALSGNEKANFRKNHFGIIFQDYNIIERMTVIENIIFALQLIGYQGDIKDRAKEVLIQVELGQYGDRLINELSGGQQQRIGIARAIAADPDIIFADEPTGNLDSETAFEIMELLKKFNADGKTIVLITHDEKLIPFANRVITINEGEIVSDEVAHEFTDTNASLTSKNKFSFTGLLSLGAKNLWRYKFRYFFVNVIIIAALLIFAGGILVKNGTNDLLEELTQTKIYIHGEYTEKGNMSEFPITDDKYKPMIEELEATYDKRSDIGFSATSDPTAEESPENGDAYVNIEIIDEAKNNTKDFYLIAGEEADTLDEVVISENVITNLIDKTYIPGSSDPTSYIGQKIAIYPVNYIYNEKTEQDNREILKPYTFTIVGVDNSSKMNSYQSSIYTTQETMTSVSNEYHDAIYMYTTQKLTTSKFEKMEDIEKILEKYDITSEHADVYSPQIAGFDPFLIISVALIIVISLVSIVCGMTMMSIVKRREKEIGIYYSLGLNQLSIFKTLAVEFCLNAVILSLVLCIIIRIIVEFAFMSNYVVKPVVLFYAYDYVLLFIVGLVISVCSLFVILIYVLRQDPIKIIRKI